MNDDERAIREVIDTWMSATSTGDVETVLSLMDNEVVFLVHGRPPFGKQEFAQQSKSMAGHFDGRSDVFEVRVAGDWAYCWTHLEVTMTVDDRVTPIRRSGHRLSVFRKLANDRWVLYRDANLLARVGD